MTRRDKWHGNEQEYKRHLAEASKVYDAMIQQLTLFRKQLEMQMKEIS